MKVNHSKMKYLATPCLVFLSLVVRSQVSNCLSGPVDFGKEYPIEVNTYPYIINEDTIRKRIDLFNECVKCTATAARCILEPLKVKASDMVSLYKIAESIRSTNRNCSDSKCITGIWIHLAMTKEGTFKYYFQPAVYRGSRLDPKSQPLFDRITIGQVYAYVDSFVVANKNRPARTYRKSIRIRRSVNATDRHRRGNFRNIFGFYTRNWNGDTRRVFYSFREILGFYQMMNPNERPNEFYCKNIYLNSYADKFDSLTRSNSSKGFRVKHTIYITTDSDTSAFKMKEVAISATTSSGADLAHVCPSVCSQLSYPSSAEAQLQKENILKEMGKAIKLE